MKSLAITSALAVGLAANLAQSTDLKFDERQLLDLATTQVTELQDLIGDVESDYEPSCPRKPEIGLRTGKLTTGSLQGAKGMGCGGGLTPIEEWRRMFPRTGQR